MKLIDCTCKHKYQDDKYGSQKRMANPTTKGKTADNKAKIFRCTVCCKEVG